MGRFAGAPSFDTRHASRLVGGVGIRSPLGRTIRLALSPNQDPARDRSHQSANDPFVDIREIAYVRSYHHQTGYLTHDDRCIGLPNNLGCFLHCVCSKCLFTWQSLVDASQIFVANYSLRISKNLLGICGRFRPASATSIIAFDRRVSSPLTAFHQSRVISDLSVHDLGRCAGDWCGHRCGCLA